MTGAGSRERCLSGLPFDSTSHSLPVGCHIDDPARQLLHLPQDVLAQMLPHQPGQARFVLLESTATALELWDQARQFPTLDEAEEDLTCPGVKCRHQRCPVQA